MPLELIEQNIKQEKKIISQIVELSTRKEQIIFSRRPIDMKKKDLMTIDKSIAALLSQFQILNNAIPDMVESIVFFKKLEPSSEDSAKNNKKLINVKFTEENGKEANLAIRKKEEDKFLESLAEKDSLAKKIDMKSADSGRLSGLARFVAISNKLFINPANKLVEKGYFNNVKIDLRKITSPFMVSSYATVVLFSTFLSFIFSIVLLPILILLGIQIATAIIIFFLIPIATFLFLYSYPSIKKKSLEKEINQELPFLTIFMSAIATSGIEPSKIFSILVNSKDYPATNREIKKLTNYLNFYGSDLVSALKLVAKNNPSERLGELFDGLATTITSGGAITEFLNKHSETLLFDYRLEREKYTRVAETFMNIYISVVIAAPMIMMILFVVMSLTGFGSAFLTPGMIGLIIILAISLINAFFIVFLNMKQPKF